jgi:hypothetical protein
MPDLPLAYRQAGDYTAGGLHHQGHISTKVLVSLAKLNVLPSFFSALPRRNNRPAISPASPRFSVSRLHKEYGDAG